MHVRAHFQALVCVVFQPHILSTTFCHPLVCNLIVPEACAYWVIQAKGFAEMNSEHLSRLTGQLRSPDRSWDEVNCFLFRPTRDAFCSDFLLLEYYICK